MPSTVFDPQRARLFALAMLAATSSLRAQCPVVFAPQATFNAGGQPLAVALGDFNRDGRLDLAVATDGVSILLGNGNGTFQQYTPYQAGVGPKSVVIGEFSRDGKLDVAVANQGGLVPGDASVSILLGNGDGTLQGALTIPQSVVTAYPSGIAIADFNADGRIDLAMTNTASNDIMVLLGNGNGTFTRFNGTADTLGHPTMVVIGDFNRDGKDDMAAPDFLSSSISVFLGNGNATFQPAMNFTVGAGPIAAAVGDLNHDGRLDLAVANQTSATVAVLLGNGDGTFQPAQTYNAGNEPRSIALGDMNGDGLLDVVVSNGDNHISILLGSGSGTLLPLVQYPVGSSSPQGLAIGDLDGDGRLDIVVACDSSSNVTVLRQIGGSGVTITLQPTRAAVAPGGTASFTVGTDAALPVSYQWRMNGVALADAPTGTGSVTTGVHTPTLTLSNVAVPDYGSAFDCIITTPCGPLRSDPAGLGDLPHCPADFDRNGLITPADIASFVNAWFASLASGC